MAIFDDSLRKITTLSPKITFHAAFLYVLRLGQFNKVLDDDLKSQLFFRMTSWDNNFFFFKF